METKPKTKTSVLNESTRQAILRTFVDIDEFIFAAGLNGKISRTFVKQILAGEPQAAQRTGMIETAWLLFQHPDFTRKQAEELVACMADWVAKNVTRKMTIPVILANLRRFNAVEPFNDQDKNNR